MRKGPDCDYDKRNITVVIWNTDIPQQLVKSWWRQEHFRSNDFNLTSRNPWLGNFLVKHQLSITEVTTGTMSYQLRDMYSYADVVGMLLHIYKWKVQNGKLK